METRKLEGEKSSENRHIVKLISIIFHSVIFLLHNDLKFKNFLQKANF